MLLAGGAKIDEPMAQFPSTPLILAVQTKQEEVARILVEHGANLDVQNEVFSNSFSLSLFFI